MRWLWGIAALLVLWAGIAALRRKSEYAHRRIRRPEPPRATTRVPDPDDDDEIDWETLEEAEREVKDLEPGKDPEEGFKGDDWGPGAPRGFPPVP